MRKRILAPVCALVLAGAVALAGNPSAHAADTLLSQGRPALASSLENGESPAIAAFAG